MKRVAWLVLVAGCSLTWNQESKPDATTYDAEADAVNGADAAVDAAPHDWSASYLKDPAPVPNDDFGYAVAISSAGDTIAVGAPYATTGGYVDVFTRTGATWTRQTRLTVAGADPFGFSLALSADGSVLAVGAFGTNAAYVFTRTITTWSAPVTVTPTAATDQFGWSIAIDDDGNRLVVGARGENGNGGGAYLFTHGTTWTQTAHLTPATASAFGHSVATNADGSTVAVGAPGQGGTGAVYIFVDGVQQQVIAEYGPDIGNRVALSSDGDSLAIAARDDNIYGAAYLYARSGTTWTKAARMAASNQYIPPGPLGLFNLGSSLAMSNDATVVVAGAFGETSNATGLDGDQSNHSDMNAGAAYMFERTSGAYPQTHYLKATNTDPYDAFAGYSVALDRIGHTLVVGAPYERSCGLPASNDCASAGAVYVYSR